MTGKALPNRGGKVRISVGVKSRGSPPFKSAACVMIEENYVLVVCAARRGGASVYWRLVLTIMTTPPENRCRCMEKFAYGSKSRMAGCAIVAPGVDCRGTKLLFHQSQGSEVLARHPS